MSKSSSEENPEILVNGERQESRAATAEDLDAKEKEAQQKMQSVIQQVRTQIRSQVSAKTQKSSILELVHKLRDKETEAASVSSEDEGKEEENQAMILTDEMNSKVEELRAMFEEKLEANKKALQDEFHIQICQVRKEMQAYTNQAVKDLETKMQSMQTSNLPMAHVKEPPEVKTLCKKQNSSAAPLPSKRGRVLTRTMTTIIPKTCVPVVVGPRAKSETLSSSKVESCRDSVLSSPGNKSYQSRHYLPPTRPPLHQYRKPVQGKGKPGARLTLGDK